MIKSKSHSIEEIKPKFKECIIENRIPKTGYQNLSYDWFSTDLEHRSHPTQFNHEINYKFNDHGYRCPSFIVENNSKSVLTLGCSFSFGNGIPERLRYSAVFCNLLKSYIGKNVVDWNLSWPGSSGDYASRIATTAIPCLKPNIVIVNFPHSPRREYFDIDGNIFQYRPDRQAKTPKDSDIMKHYHGLSSPHQDAYNMLKNYQIIRNICDMHNCVFLYATLHVDDKIYDLVKHCFDYSHRAKSMIKTDVARDGGHPGVSTHAEHGKNFFDSYLRNYSV